MDTKQAKFVWADATEFFWILIPAGAPIWESNILPAVPPRHNVSSVGLLQCTGLLCSYMGASINTKQKNSFQCQEHHTRSVPADALWFTFPGSSLSKAKWKIEDFCPFIPSQQFQTFLGVSVPVLCFQCYVSVPDSSHWTLCILRRAHSSLPLPVCAHLCLCSQSKFSLFRSLRHFSTEGKQTIFLTVLKKNKGKKVSLRIISVAREVTGVKSREEFAPERKSTRNQHTSWALPYFLF